MDIDVGGNVTASRVFESAIKSAKRFTYDDVDKILTGDNLSGLPPKVIEDVRVMGKLAQRLRKKRFARGSLDFDFPEPYTITDPHGRPIDIRRRERLESHRLIEDFMLLANETVADFMKQGPFLYRIHEKPDPMKIKSLRATLQSVGVPIPQGFDQGMPHALQTVVKFCQGKPIQPMVQMMILRSLKQAIYSETNKGHYGLASTNYTHFTSPIRRYPDLIVHRLIKDKIHGKLTGQRQKIWMTNIPPIASHCSKRERIAVDAEREFLDVQRVRLMEKRVGQTFAGVISGVTRFGLFITLKEPFVEGLVHMTNLKDDYYFYDEVRVTLRGKRTGKTFRMGQPVNVLLAGANIVKHQLDFELVK
jgi:ribonuclease R